MTIPAVFLVSGSSHRLYIHFDSCSYPIHNKSLKHTSMDSSIRDFVAQQRRWLQEELECDNNNNTNHHGSSSSSSADDDHAGTRQNVLHNLQVTDVSVGLYGRTVLTLSSSTNASLLLPAHRFTTGDEVELRNKSNSNINNNNNNHASSSSSHRPGGVICQVTENSISMALFENNRKESSSSSSNNQQDEDEYGSPPLSLLAKSSIEVHKKMVQALDELEKQGINHPIAGAIIRAQFDSSVVASSAVSNPVVQEPFSNQLNESQLDAIAFALTESRPVALIHGPPGTG